MWAFKKAKVSVKALYTKIVCAIELKGLFSYETYTDCDL